MKIIDSEKLEMFIQKHADANSAIQNEKWFY